MKPGAPVKMVATGAPASPTVATGMNGSNPKNARCWSGISPGSGHLGMRRRLWPGLRSRPDERWSGSCQQLGCCRVRRVDGILKSQSSNIRRNAMDRLDELEMLIAVLESGSLAAAGRRLRRSAPTVTRMLAALEHRIGTKLVERTTRHLAPTDAGQALANALGRCSIYTLRRCRRRWRPRSAVWCGSPRRWCSVAAT